MRARCSAPSDPVAWRRRGFARRPSSVLAPRGLFAARPLRLIHAPAALRAAAFHRSILHRRAAWPIASGATLLRSAQSGHASIARWPESSPAAPSALLGNGSARRRLLVHHCRLARRNPPPRSSAVPSLTAPPNPSFNPDPLRQAALPAQRTGIIMRRAGKPSCLRGQG